MLLEVVVSKWIIKKEHNCDIDNALEALPWSPRITRKIANTDHHMMRYGKQVSCDSHNIISIDVLSHKGRVRYFCLVSKRCIRFDTS